MDDGSPQGVGILLTAQEWTNHTLISHGAATWRDVTDTGCSYSAPSGDELTWSASTNADAAELVRHTATSRCPRALVLAFAPPSGRGIAHARCARHRHALRTRAGVPVARLFCVVVLCHRAALQCIPLGERA